MHNGWQLTILLFCNEHNTNKTGLCCYSIALLSSASLFLYKVKTISYYLNKLCEMSIWQMKKLRFREIKCMLTYIPLVDS